MSQENVEIVKRFSRIFERGDREEWRKYFDPDVVMGHLRDLAVCEIALHAARPSLWRDTSSRRIPL